MTISFFQRTVLERMRRACDKSGRTYYTGPSRTRDALERQGMIERAPGPGYDGYVVTDAGRLALDGRVTRDNYTNALMAKHPIDMTPKPIKTCSCGKTYTKLSWKLLDFVGYFDDNEPADPEHPEWGEPMGRCEQRNCVCGSTITVPLKELEDP